MRLEGKAALVTGAASGIGLAAAALMAREGAKVALFDQVEGRLDDACDRINRAGGTAIEIHGDVSRGEDVERAVERAARELGGLQIVFANAGINGVWAPLDELAPEEWDRTLDVNLKGTFLAVKYAVPHLKKSGGSVIVTSSVNGTRIFSNVGATAYSCSKAGQVAFAKMAALELAPHRVRVNVICPGAIETAISESTERRDLDKAGPRVEMPKGHVPLTKGEPGSPEQVARLVVFLASDESDHISGARIFIDGAESLLQG